MTVEAPVADILDYAIGGGWGKEEPDQAHTLPVYVLRGTDMPNVTLGDLSTLPYRYENEKKGLRRALLPNDIVLEISGGSSARGQSTGRTVFITEAILKELAAPLIPASFCRLLRIKAEVANPRYVYYCLQEMYNSGRAATYEVQSTGISNFQFKYFLEAELVPLPSLTEQEAIAEILGALDDKIELNRKMNATLDELARTIFRSWFVNFDPVRAKMEGREPFGMDAETAALFPDRLEESPLGPIPEGWEAKRIDELADINKSSLKASDEWETIRYVDISSTRQGDITETTTYRRGDEPSRAKRRLSHGDTALSTVRPNRRSYFLALDPPDDLIASTGFAIVSPTMVPWSFIHSGLTQDAVFDTLGNLADGGAYPAVRPSVIGELTVNVPTDERLMNAYHGIAGSLYELAARNREESRTLAELRDTLLPELISGRTRVPDAEKVVAEVV